MQANRQTRGLNYCCVKNENEFCHFQKKQLNLQTRMKDYNDIAKRYAEKNGYGVVRPSTERIGYRYFHVDYTERPRYLGHPHIIKISPAGKVLRVLNVDEIYWAVKQAKEPLQQT